MNTHQVYSMEKRKNSEADEVDKRVLRDPEGLHTSRAHVSTVYYLSIPPRKKGAGMQADQE